MLKTTLIAATSLLVLTVSAQAAPGLGGRSFAASESTGSSSNATARQSPLAAVLDFFQIGLQAKAVAAAAPQQGEPSEEKSGAIKECEENSQPVETAKKKDGPKLAKRSGPEPVYLAF